jgi:hypothetical protein
MDKRTTGIVATVIAVLLCGCPGLVGLCVGAMFAVLSFIPGAQIDIFGNNDPKSALTFGVGVLCLSVFMIAIPLIVGVLLLRKKNNEVTEALPPSEPLPPAI